MEVTTTSNTFSPPVSGRAPLAEPLVTEAPLVPLRRTVIAAALWLAVGVIFACVRVPATEPV